ncbi:uncharacterized protein LOC5508004 [Nematostella vectensis]|uniref:uncharacterized protein LOC5508004 n=1 Tax=Nematostella vectensis TaxID=45351 RepID=UPI002077882C|nr:uncharacterized protein LOC5508004 [Nematostella vectensis]
MSDLPKDRVNPSPPFTYSAADYFGPWTVKEGRREVKRYGVLFTCMASRAVHIETASSLDTSSFLNAYRPFVGRRGPVRQLRSDRGTNFVGAKNELQSPLSEMDNQRVGSELRKENCDWVDFKFNVPDASHRGGSWERQIRTVRNVLDSLLYNQGTQLDDESLRTLLVEAEAIVNSRPLSADSDSCAADREPYPDDEVVSRPSTALRLQASGHVLEETLRSAISQHAQKWTRPRRNLEVGDIVIVKDESLHRNDWRLARVVEAFTSNDGLVRFVKVAVGDSSLDRTGRRCKQTTYLQRPVQKLVLLLPHEEAGD